MAASSRGWTACPSASCVNRNAERFYDEGEDFWPKRYAIWGRLVAATARSGRLCHRRREIDRSVHAVGVSAEKADSIEALAVAIGLDPATTRATIDRFNAACRPGTFDHTIHDDCRTEGLDPPKIPLGAADR